MTVRLVRRGHLDGKELDFADGPRGAADIHVIARPKGLGKNQKNAVGEAGQRVLHTEGNGEHHGGKRRYDPRRRKSQRADERQSERHIGDEGYHGSDERGSGVIQTAAFYRPLSHRESQKSNSQKPEHENGRRLDEIEPATAEKTSEKLFQIVQESFHAASVFPPQGGELCMLCANGGNFRLSFTSSRTACRRRRRGRERYSNGR